ncbi:MAG: hypothetical protein WC574_06505 [Candidatus Omnitrophota bacterium]
MNIKNYNQQSCAELSNSILPESYKVKKLFFTILYSLCLALSLISFIWNIDVLIKVNMLLGMLAIILLSTRIRREYVSIYIFVGFLVISFLVSSLFVGRTGWRSFQPYVFITSSFGAALILVRRYVYNWGGYIVFYGLASYFLMLMFTGVPGYAALKYCSRNGISMVILVACVSLYIILSMEKKKIDLKPAFLTLVISIWGIGRSGIVSSLVLFLGLLFISFRAKLKFIYYAIICLFIAYFAWSKFAMDYSFFRNARDSFIVGEEVKKDPVRWAMWTNYFNNLDTSRVIFGVNVVKDLWPEGEINEYNYHNSFINLHLQTGFMGLMTLILIIFALFKFYRTNKVFFFLLLALILRASSDLFIFFNRFDFIPFFFIFYYLKDLHFHVPHINRYLQ